MLFDMKSFVYNDTFARNHVPPIALPVPREFTVVYIDGWGSRAFDAVQPSLKVRHMDRDFAGLDFLSAVAMYCY